MKHLFDKTHRSVSGRRKSVLAGAILAIVLVLQSSPAFALQSPHGRELLGADQFMTLETMTFDTLMTATSIELRWNYPVSRETPDLIFKLYHSPSLLVPVQQWILLTNVLGNVRSVRLTASLPRDYFALTASNYLGESTYATR